MIPNVTIGYKPELRRNLSIWSLLGFGFSVCNSWWGASASLGAGLLSGGPGIVFHIFKLNWKVESAGVCPSSHDIWSYLTCPDLGLCWGIII